MNLHTATILWERDENAPFVDNRYSRAHRWRFDGGAEVEASASPSVVPLPMSVESAVDPEEAFVASISSCHMLWFLSIAAKEGFVVDTYRDEAAGTMAANEAGAQAITEVVLRPRIAFEGRRPSPEEHRAIHEEAHHRCFIANSIRSEVRCEEVVVGGVG